MEAISDLPMLNDMDADYSPQYVKLARILRDKIKSGELQARRHPARLRPGGGVRRVGAGRLRALAMLAANRYIERPRAPQVLPRRLAGRAMSSEQGHSVAVETDSITALEPTRVPRHGRCCSGRSRSPVTRV